MPSFRHLERSSQKFTIFWFAQDFASPKSHNRKKISSTWRFGTAVLHKIFLCSGQRFLLADIPMDKIIIPMNRPMSSIYCNMEMSGNKKTLPDLHGCWSHNFKISLSRAFNTQFFVCLTKFKKLIINDAHRGQPCNTTGLMYEFCLTALFKLATIKISSFIYSIIHLGWANALSLPNRLIFYL